MTQLGMSLLRFNLFGSFHAFCTFFRFGKFSAVISSSTFLILFSLFSFSGTCIMWILVLVCLVLFQRSLKLFSFLKVFFFFAGLVGWFPLFCLPDHLYILLFHWVCYSFLIVWFSFQLLYSLFLTISFLYFLVPLKKSHCLSILFPNSASIFIY